MQLEEVFNIITSITSVIAIIISFITLKKMYEQDFENNKGEINIYIDTDPINSKAYLIIKNCGKSSANLLYCNCDKEIIPKVPDELKNKLNIQSLLSFKDYLLMPNQKIVQEIDYNSIKDTTLLFVGEYLTLNRKIKFNYSTNTNYLSHQIFWRTKFTQKSDLSKMLNELNNSILLIAQKLD